MVASPEELRENQFHTRIEDAIEMTAMRHHFNPTSCWREEKESRKRLSKITPSLDYTTTKVESYSSFVREINKGHEHFSRLVFRPRSLSLLKHVCRSERSGSEVVAAA